MIAKHFELPFIDRNMSDLSCKLLISENTKKVSLGAIGFSLEKKSFGLLCFV